MNEPVPLVLRLVTGEDIIADAVFHNEAGNARYILSDPLKIVYLPATGKETSISLSLMQWMFTRISENQTFEMNERNVLFTTDPSDSLVQYYYKTVDYFYQVKEQQQNRIKVERSKLQDELYEEFALSEDEDLSDLMNSDEMQELKEFLEQLSKKDKGSLH